MLDRNFQMFSAKNFFSSAKPDVYVSIEVVKALEKHGFIIVSVKRFCDNRCVSEMAGWAGFSDEDLRKLKGSKQTKTRINKTTKGANY